MSWPDDQAYNEAVQNPRVCFADAELKTGVVATGPSGLPKVASGNFASVYQIKCPSRLWEVRCFRREVTDQKPRYAAISEHLKRVNLPFIVGFDFLRDGSRVAGRWYPILKMEWVGGKCLDHYVRDTRDQPDKLLRLLRNWISMVEALRRSQVAHGDLQHGNVLIVGDSIKLIDYDGMYVPALAGRPSIEYGHPNYQHPGRSDHDFGPDLDNFSNWIVATSLLALHAAPYLWEMLQGGDERLLLGRGDFVDPRNSHALTALRQCGSAPLATLADFLTNSLIGQSRNVPPLDTKFLPSEEPREETGLPTWVREQVPIEPASRAGHVKTAEPVRLDSGADWLVEHLAEQESGAPLDFSGALIVERICVVITFALMMAMVVSGGAVPLVVSAVSTVAICGLLLVERYRTRPVVLRKSSSDKELRSACDQERRAAKDLQHFASSAAGMESNRNKRRAELEQQLKEVKSRFEAAVLKAQSECDALVAKQGGERRRIMEEEAAEILAAEARANSVLGPLNAELTRLQAAERDERARALQSLQNDYITEALERECVALAHFSGIGTELKSRLQSAGIITAADVSNRRVSSVYGFGAQRAKALVMWRGRIEFKSRQSMPQALSVADDVRIRESFAARGRALSSQISDRRLQLDATKQSTHDQFRLRTHMVDAEIHTARKGLEQRKALIRSQSQAQEQRVQVERSQATEEARRDQAAVIKERSQKEKQIFQARLATARQRRECARFRDVTFLNFLLRIVGARRAR